MVKMFLDSANINYNRHDAKLIKPNLANRNTPLILKTKIEMSVYHSNQNPNP
jgi:hypothetical protein